MNAYMLILCNNALGFKSEHSLEIAGIAAYRGDHRGLLLLDPNYIQTKVVETH